MEKMTFSQEPYADGICITGCSGEENVIRVPAAIDGLPVRKIGEEAFAYLSAEEVLLPDTLQVIGKKAFAFCFSLKEVRLPEGLQTLEESCFLCTQIRQLVLPASLQKMGRPETFDMYLETQEEYPVYYGDGPGLYRKSADGLQLVSLHTETETSYCVCEGTVRLEGAAFLNVQERLHLSLPASLREIDGHAFAQKLPLSVAVHPDNPVFFSDAQGLWERLSDGRKLLRYLGGSFADLPSDAVLLGAYSLAGITLEELHLPECCQAEANAFRNASVRRLFIGGPLLMPEGPVENERLLNTIFAGGRPDLTPYDDLLLTGYLSYHRVKMSFSRIDHIKTPEEIRAAICRRLTENGRRVAEFMIKAQDVPAFLQWLSLPGQTAETLEAARAALSEHKEEHRAVARELLAEVLKRKSLMGAEDDFSL